jgi:hypothetical protein
MHNLMLVITACLLALGMMFTLISTVEIGVTAQLLFSAGMTCIVFGVIRGIAMIRMIARFSMLTSEIKEDTKGLDREALRALVEKEPEQTNAQFWNMALFSILPPRMMLELEYHDRYDEFVSKALIKSATTNKEQ